jgi:hypothetical protein
MPTSTPEVTWESAEHWIVRIPGRRGSIALQRQSNGITFNSQEEPARQYSAVFSSSPSPVEERAKIQRRLIETAARYPRYEDLQPYRFRATYLLALIFGIQELLLAICRRRFQRYYNAARLLSMLAWALGSAWLFGIYFRT